MTEPIVAPTSCAVCGAPLPERKPGPGRYRRYCSDACGHVVRKAVEQLAKDRRRRDELSERIAEREAFLASVGRTWR